MASVKHLDKEGLSKVWDKAKAAFADKKNTQEILDSKLSIPSGGSSGQFIQKTAEGTQWGDGLTKEYIDAMFVTDEEFDEYMGTANTQSLKSQISKLNSRIQIAEARLNIEEES